MSKSAHVFLILLFSLSARTYAQKNEITCAVEKKITPNSCEFKPATKSTHTFAQLTEKFKEETSDNLDEQHELVGLLETTRVKNLDKSDVSTILQSIQRIVLHYEKNLARLEGNEKKIDPKIAAEIDKLSKMIHENLKKQTELTDKYFQAKDDKLREKYSTEYKKVIQLLDVNEKKLKKLERSVGITEDDYKLVVEDKFKPQTIEYLKKTISKLKVYENDLKNTLEKNDLKNPTSISSYYKAVGIIDLDEIAQVITGETWPCGLTNIEYYMLRQYTASAYKQINSALRAGSKHDNYEQIKKQANIINRALDKIASHTKLVQRGADYMPADVQKAHCVGCIVEYSAFTSTSIAQAFRGNYQFTIQSKNGKYVAPLSRSPDEEEVLFKAGTRFKILKVATLGDSTLYTMQEVE